MAYSVGAKEVSKYIPRHDLWRARFEKAIDDAKQRPFNWDGNECVIGLCANVILAITGTDLAAEYRGKFKDALSAARLMKQMGFDNIADLTASFLEEYERGPSQAKIGDLVAIPDDTPFGYSLGVVNGERVFVLTETGMGTVDLLSATRAFRVGG